MRLEGGMVMSNQASAKAKKPEFFRKILVSLKRRPQMIPFLVLIISFLVYSLNLTHISDTTAKIQGVGMGLCQYPDADTDVPHVRHCHFL